MRTAWVLGLAVAWLLGAPAAAQDEPARLALLIGNERYPAEVGRLSRPHEDVSVLAEALRATGFEVRERRDLNREAMYQAVQEFRDELAEAGDGVTGFFYYAGHGASAEERGARTNYLMPARAPIVNADDLRRDGVSLDFVLDQVREGLDRVQDGAAFIITDACRNTLEPAMGERGGARGFVVERPRSGLFLAYATTDGDTAPDDGLFADTLAEEIRRPDQLASLAFIRTARRIADRRGDENALPVIVPYLTRDFCFLGCADPEAAQRGFGPSELLALESRFRAQFQHRYARLQAGVGLLAAIILIGGVLVLLRSRVTASMRKPGVHRPRPPVLLRVYGVVVALGLLALVLSGQARETTSGVIDVIASTLPSPAI